MSGSFGRCRIAATITAVMLPQKLSTTMVDVASLRWTRLSGLPQRPFDDRPWPACLVSPRVTRGCSPRSQRCRLWPLMTSPTANTRTIEMVGAPPPSRPDIDRRTSVSAASYQLLGYHDWCPRALYQRSRTQTVVIVVGVAVVVAGIIIGITVTVKAVLRQASPMS